MGLFHDRDARKLHSITLMSLSFAMNWMLKGPVIFRAAAICLAIVFTRLMVSR